MPIHIPTIINELRENATEEQRKGLSILDSRFYECIELKKKLDIATSALQYYADKDKWDYEHFYTTKDGWYDAEQALKEIDLVGTPVSLADNKIQANRLADNKLQAKEEV